MRTMNITTHNTIHTQNSSVVLYFFFCVSLYVKRKKAMKKMQIKVTHKIWYFKVVIDSVSFRIYVLSFFGFCVFFMVSFNVLFYFML